MVAIALCLGVIFALSEIIKGWVVGVWAISAFSILYVSIKGETTLFTQWTRTFIAIFLVAIEIFLDRFSEWQFVLAQVLLILLAIKLLELRTQRDIYQIAGLSLLALGVASFLRIDLTLGFIILWVLATSIILMLWQQIYQVIRKKRKITRKLGIMSFGWITLSGVLFTIAIIPISFFFFFLLPRTPVPIWKWATPPSLAKTGFSPEMSPGTISRIIQDTSVAFRAKIWPHPKNPEDIYWTGAVLWKMDGENWLPGHPTNFKSLKINARIFLNITTQTIILPPISESYLFSIPHPVNIKGPYGILYNKDGTLKLSYPQRLPIRYEVTSVSGWKENLLPKERKAALEIPANIDPKILSLAEELKNKCKNPNEIATATVNFLKSPPFSYSLSAPPGFAAGQNLSDFLFKTHIGYCELYSSAMALLLRLNGIPARNVVGYRGGEYNPIGDYWLIRESMAHAWTEAWIDGKGWVLFDATPSMNLDQIQASNSASSKSNYLMSLMRTWDWMQWQWQNVVIDMTPAKQRKIWFETGQRIGRVMSWNISWFKMKGSPRIPGAFSFSLFHLLILLIMALLAAIYFFKKHKRDKRVKNTLRRLAARRLEKATPIKIKLKDPGRENQYWIWWKKHYPNLFEAIKQIYYSQRYGRSPSKEGDERLKEILNSRRKQ